MSPEHRILCGFLLAVSLCAAGDPSALPLTNPEAPFAQDKKEQKEDIKPFLDEAANAFRFGSKSVQVHPNGYIHFINSGRKVANIYFYGNTPYSSYFDNRIRHGRDVKKVPYAFSKKQPGVTDFSVDKKTNSFIIKGKIPYHKDGEAELTGNYTQTVTLTPDSKIRVKLEYTRPEAAEKGFLAMIAEIPQAKTYETAGKNQEFPEKSGRRNR